MWGSTGIKFWASYFCSLNVNDLPNCLDQAELLMFADDTNVSTSAASVEKLIQLNSELDNTSRWFLLFICSSRLTISLTTFV